jgi:hypothetical protein
MRKVLKSVLKNLQAQEKSLWRLCSVQVAVEVIRGTLKLSQHAESGQRQL